MATHAPVDDILQKMQPVGKSKPTPAPDTGPGPFMPASMIDVQQLEAARHGAPIGDIAREGGEPRDPSHWIINTIKDLGIVGADTIQGLSNPLNMALMAAMAVGNEEAALPFLANLGFKASMLTDAVGGLAKGVKEARKGNIEEAGRQFSDAGVKTLLVLLGSRGKRAQEGKIEASAGPKPVEPVEAPVVAPSMPPAISTVPPESRPVARPPFAGFQGKEAQVPGSSRVMPPAPKPPEVPPPAATATPVEVEYQGIRHQLESIGERATPERGIAPEDRSLLRKIFPDYTERAEPDRANDFAYGIWRMANIGDEVHRIPTVDLAQRIGRQNAPRPTSATLHPTGLEEYDFHADENGWSVYHRQSGAPLVIGAPTFEEAKTKAQWALGDANTRALKEPATKEVPAATAPESLAKPPVGKPKAPPLQPFTDEEKYADFKQAYEMGMSRAGVKQRASVNDEQFDEFELRLRHEHHVARDARRAEEAARAREAAAAAEAEEKEKAKAKEAALKAKLEQPPTLPPEFRGFTPPDIFEMPTAEIESDPERFQFKRDVGAGGVSSLLKQAKKWERGSVGVLTVWRDPADGKIYVTNGHHRLELANRFGVESLPVRLSQAVTAEEAMVEAAMQNIRDEKGTATDAAKIFRLRPEGVSLDKLKESIGVDSPNINGGIALANLDDLLWQKVHLGGIPEKWGIMIGETVPRGPAQDAALKMLERVKKRRLTDQEMRYALRFAMNAPSQTTSEDTLFGTQQMEQSLALEKAELAGEIERRLGAEKRLFGAAAGGAGAIEQRGVGRIKESEARQISKDAAQAREVFRRLADKVGPINDILDKAVKEIASGKGKSKAAIEKETYGAILDAVKSALNAGGVAENPLFAPTNPPTVDPTQPPKVE